MEGYIKLQIKFIRVYAKYLHVSDEIASRIWIERKLANRFAKLNRKKFGLPEEK